MLPFSPFNPQVSYACLFTFMIFPSCLSFSPTFSISLTPKWEREWTNWIETSFPCICHNSLSSEPAAGIYVICLHFEQVFDKDIGQDKQLGIAKLPLIDLQGEVNKEFELRLLASLNTLKVKDKKDRGTLTIKVEFRTSTEMDSVCLYLFYSYVAYH